MADPTQIDTLQDQLARQHEVAVKMQALQRVLQAFAPALLQEAVDYATLLVRVRTVLDIEATGTPDPVPSTPPHAQEGDTDDV